MIDLICSCGQQASVSEDAVGQAISCPSCGRVLCPICAEALDEGAGAGDFDASLTIEAGPSRVGERLALGGVAEVEIGKQARHILLSGVRVSRQHCRLQRVDFGPSRWQLIDNNSTNGLFVNGARVKDVELTSGDQVQIGEYTLTYHVDSPTPEAPPAAPVAASAARATKAVKAAALPTTRRASAKPASATADNPSGDGWSAEEGPLNKFGFYIVMIPSLIAAALASGFAGEALPIGPLCGVVAIAGVIGGIVNILGRGPLWAGALVGAVMGLGGFGAVAWWIHGRERVLRLELFVAFIVGAAPGFGLQTLLQKISQKRAAE